MAVYTNYLPCSSRCLPTVAAFALLAAFWCPSLSAQGPTVDRIDASEMRPGARAGIVVTGKQLAGGLGLWTPFGVFRPKEGSDLSKDQPVTLEGDVSDQTIPGIYPARFVTNNGCSEASWIVVDDLPQAVLAPESEDRRSGQVLNVPCFVTGHLNAVLSRFFRITVPAGQTVSIEVLARRLGSELDPVIRVTDVSGREIAYRDDIPGAEGDAHLQFTAAADGEYRIELRDVRYSGGARHFFHVRLGRLSLIHGATSMGGDSNGRIALIGAAGEILGETTAAQPSEPVTSRTQLVPAAFRSEVADGSVLIPVSVSTGPVQTETEPNDAREQATAVAAETQVLTGTLATRGDTDWFRFSVTEPVSLLVTARTRELYRPTDLMLQLFNSDGGKMVENDDAGSLDAEIAAQLPAAGDYFLKVSDIAGRGGPEWTYSLDVNRGSPAVRVTSAADRVVVPRSGNAALPLTVRRIHYNGPLKIEAVGLPAGVQMTPVTIGGKQSAIQAVFSAGGAADTEGAQPADFGPVSFQVTSLNGELSSVDVTLAPPPPRKADTDPFRTARLRSDIFAAVRPAAEFSLRADQDMISVTQGTSASVMVRATRSEGWTAPIEIALSAPADQLSPGVTVAAGSMKENELEIKVTAAADAAVGPCTVFLQGKTKKDNAEVTQPVTPIVISIVAP